MTANLMSFNYDNLIIHSELINNEPWFIADEICKALGYKITRKAITDHVDEDDDLKRIAIDRLGRKQEKHWINESGLYALIFASKLPSAKQFKHWVTHEVLPSIRKTGSYSLVKKQEITEKQIPIVIPCKIMTYKDAVIEGVKYQGEIFIRYDSIVKHFPLKPCGLLPTENIPEGFRFFRTRVAPNLSYYDAHLFIADYKLLDILYKLHIKTGENTDVIRYVIQRLIPCIHLSHKSQEDFKDKIKRLEHPSWYVNE